MNQSTTTDKTRKQWDDHTPSEKRTAKIAASVILAVVALFVIGAVNGSDDTAAAPSPITVAPIAVDAVTGPPAVAGSDRNPTVDTDVTAFQMVLSRMDVPMAFEPAMVEEGRNICGALDEGASMTQIGSAFYTNFNKGAGYRAITLEQTGALIGASVSAFCPQHRDLIRD